MPNAVIRHFAASEGGVRRVLVGALALGFAALLVLVLVSVSLAQRYQAHVAAVAHTYQVDNAINMVRLPLEIGEVARRGYLLQLNPTFRRVFESALTETNPALDRLQALVMDNPSQVRRVAQLRALAARLNAARRRSMVLAEAGKVDQARYMFMTDGSADMLRAARRLGIAMVAEERRLLAIRQARERTSVVSLYIVLAVSGLFILVVAVVTLLVQLRYTRDLTRSRDALRALAESLEEKVRDRTADLRLANDEIQRFAYIVSHDLRSPLVNILGFTSELETANKALATLVDRTEQAAPDLLAAEARHAAREDLPEAIGFIRASTQKMDRLINAILKLSRQGRRIIAPQRIDTTALVGEIVATLEYRTRELGAEIVVDGALPDIVTDRAALEQIFANLIENAVKYLQPGRPGHIVVSGRREEDRIVYSISDNGRGIDPRDHQRIFDLFRRSGAQDQPGEGIGLAHVRALTYRLGGIVTVQSRLGEGSTFHLALPPVYSDPERRPS